MGVIGGIVGTLAGYQAVKTHNRSDSESSTEHRRDSSRSTLPPRSHTTNSIPSLHQRTASGEPSSSAPLLSHTRSDSYIPTFPQSPDHPPSTGGGGGFGYSDHRRNSSRMSRLSRMPPPMPLDLPTANDTPAPTPQIAPPRTRPTSGGVGGGRRSSTISPPPLARLPPEGNLLGSPLPGQGFDLSSRDNVIHSNNGTSGHGQLS